MTTRFVLRFERGSRTAPEIKGQYIAWEKGLLRLCTAQTTATRYDHAHVAADVALRAVKAYCGARVEILPVLQ